MPLTKGGLYSIKMIELTRLNDEKFMLNALMIEQVESLPDTTITLLSGKKIVVKEAHRKVVQSITEFYKTIGLQNVFTKAGEDDE